LRIGDLGLFQALLNAIDMPDRWRARLRNQFWRPEAFRQELVRLTRDPAEAIHDLPADLMARLDTADLAKSEKVVAAYLDEHKLELIGARSLREITQGLLSAAADATSKPLSSAAADLIDAYVKVKAPARAAGDRKSTRLNSSHVKTSYAVFRLKQKTPSINQAPRTTRTGHIPIQ